VKLTHLSVLAAVALFAAFGPLERTAPTRWAVVVGISDYDNFGPEIGGDLPGAANDARSMRDVLVSRWGFEPTNVKLLVDHEASRAGIKQALTQWLPSQARTGDLVVFFFAGHGSQAWDTTGTEADGLNETICPADVTKSNTDMDIVDKELGAWLRALPTDNVVAILDNCHAGDGTRAITPFARPRALDRDIKKDVKKPTTAQAAGAKMTKVSGVNQVLELAAAQSDEVAVDAEWPAEGGAPSKFGGAFTTNFVKNLWQVPTSTSYEKIFGMTREDMKRERFAQNPQLSNIKGHPAIFAIEDGSSMKATPNAEAATGYVPVSAATATTVELNGGSMAGITAGSLYKIGGELVRVSKVDATHAQATVVKAGEPAAAAGSKAHLLAYAFPPSVLRVSVADLAPAARAALTKELSGITGVELVTNATEFAHVLVRPKGDQYIVIGLDGAVRHKVPATSPAAAAAALGTVLRQEIGAHELASVENPAQPFALDFGFTGDKSTFKLNDPIEFRVRSARDGYLTIVDLGTDGKVVVVYPNADDKDNRIRAGEEKVIPTPSMKSMFVAQEPLGRGIVRAFITAVPLDLPFTEGDATQSALVAQALRKSAGAPPVAGANLVSVGNWATASVVYEITK
jgi:hypothetical protein